VCGLERHKALISVKALVRALARLAEGSEKRDALVYADSGTRPPALDSQPSWTAHLILEQFE